MVTDDIKLIEPNSTRIPWNPTQGSGEPCLTLNNCYPTCADWKTKLNGMGVEAVLDERDDGMPEFHFGEFGGGLSWWVNKGSTSLSGRRPKRRL